MKLSKENILDVVTTALIFFTVSILYEFFGNNLSFQESLKNTLNDESTYWMVGAGFVGSSSRILLDMLKLNRAKNS